MPVASSPPSSSGENLAIRRSFVPAGLVNGLEPIGPSRPCRAHEARGLWGPRDRVYFNRWSMASGLESTILLFFSKERRMASSQRWKA